MSPSLAKLKANFLLPASALFFFCLETRTKAYLPGIPVAVIVVAILAASMPPIKDTIRSAPKPLAVLSALTAAGACWAGKNSLLDTLYGTSAGISFLEDVLSHPLIANAACWAIAIAGMFAVFVWALWVFTTLNAHARDTGLSNDLSPMEKTAFLAIVAIVGIITTYAYVHSNAYYASEHAYNVVYSSDSASIFKGNAFLVITHSQNDIRQPLFGAFALPFFGAAFLLSRIFPDQLLAQAILYNYVQLALLAASFIIVAHCLDFDRKRRLAFTLACATSFMFLEYAFAVEQYIVAFFWLSFALHALLKRRDRTLGVVSSTGTLLTGAFIAVFASDARKLKDWATSVARMAASFLVAMLAFCRMDVFITVVKQTMKMVDMTGTSVPLQSRAYQYVCFVADCFVTPPSLEKDVWGFPSWWYDDTLAAFCIGATLLALCLASLVIHRKKRLVQIAALWICLSLFLTCGLGWGTNENCLVLYCLYFGWTFAVLLVLLLDTISKRIGSEAAFFVPLALGATAMIVVNVPAFAAMIDFCNTVYPL